LTLTTPILEGTALPLLLLWKKTVFRSVLCREKPVVTLYAFLKRVNPKNKGRAHNCRRSRVPLEGPRSWALSFVMKMGAVMYPGRGGGAVSFEAFSLANNYLALDGWGEAIRL